MTTAKVYLVGAGPGHPGLLTLRAVECLRQAEVVLYDKLVPVGLLEHAPATAVRRCVAELSECHSERHLAIHAAMIDAARQGKCVVRLKGGDPLLFGRGGEEAEALRAADVPFEIVPGVTAALSAAAFAGIPLTHRMHASAVALVTGHEKPSAVSALDWPALARFPGTLVFYMAMTRLASITQELIAHGKPENTPAAVVHRASTGEQQTVEAPLGQLVSAVQRAGVTAPAIIIVGSVVSLRPKLSWFEERPLFGKRVLVTRPRHQAGDLVHRLELLGAVPVVLPAVEIHEPADWAPVDRALQDLGTYHWVVFTSANGVHAFVNRLRQVGRDLRALGPVKLAAIGPKTAAALQHYHLQPDLVPARFQSEDLAAALKSQIAPGQRVLLARADRGRDVLRQELASHAQVEQVAVYSQIDAVDHDDEVLDRLRRGEIDYITLTSSNIARALLGRLDATCRLRLEAGETKLVSISPVTSADIRQLGLAVAAEAAEATVEGIIEALVGLAGQTG